MWWTQAPERYGEGAQNTHPVVSCYDADSGEWDEYVAGHPASSLYHLIAWRRVIEKSCPHKCFYLIARRDGNAVGVLPLTLVRSRFFGDYLVSAAFADVGGICSDDWKVSESLLNAAIDLRGKCRARYIELRHARMLANANLTPSTNKIMPVLTLPRSKDELWRTFEPKLRNQIRKSEKADLKPAWGSDELVTPFYDVYARNMRDLGSPVISIHFFQNIVRELKERVKVLVLYKDDLPVSGAIGLRYRQTFEVPWASSRRNYFSLNPNNRLYWEMLKWCVENGIDYFNFGRSSIDSGSYRFKKQWKPKTYELYYYFASEEAGLLSPRDPHDSRYAWAVRLWRRMPVGVTKVFGPWLAKDLT